METNPDHIERQLIGKLLIDPKIYLDFQDLFNAYEFQGINGRIFTEIAQQILTGKVNSIAIAKSVGDHFLGKQSDAILYLSNCRSGVVFNDATDEQLLFLIENRNSSQLVKGIQELMFMANENKSTDEVKNKAMEIFAGIESIGKNEIKPFIDNLSALSEVIHLNRSGKKESGLKTGLNGYDQFNGGMQYSDLEVIAGKSSMGKTAFVIGRARFVAMSGHAVGIFNYEMSAIQLTSRIISPVVPVSGKDLLMFPLPDKGLDIFNKAIATVQDLPIFIADTNNSSLQNCLRQIRYLFYKNGVRYFIVDYLQRMNIAGFRGQREQEIGEISKRLKDIAKELNVKIDLLSQLNRDKMREGKEPILSDLRDSGQIEEAADIVTFIHRPEYYLKEMTEDKDKGMAKIIQAKGRNTGVFEYKVRFNPVYTTFNNLEEDVIKTPPQKIIPNTNFSEPKEHEHTF